MDSSCLMQSVKIVSIAWRWCFWEEPCTNQVNVNIFPRYWVPPQLCCTNEHRNQKRTTGIQSQPLGHCWGLTYTDIFLLFFSAIYPGLLCQCKGRVGGRGKTTQIILSSLLWVPKQTWKLMKEQLLISKQKGQHPITYKKGVELAKRSSAHKYVMECSARFERFESNLHWDNQGAFWVLNQGKDLSSQL